MITARLFTLAGALLAISAQGATPVDGYVQKVQALVATHQASLSRLNVAANASAQNLVSGGAYYVCCGDTAWISESYGRAGGLMGMSVYLGQAVSPKDVVWVSYTASTYQSTVAAIAQLNAPSGTVVVWFGPMPPAGAPGAYWVDSLTSWSDEDDFTLTGNVLSLWSMTGEMAAATARLGKTLVFWESGELPSATLRNPDYSNLLFHTGFPTMASNIASGVLSGAYLSYISNMISQIVQGELTKLVAAGTLAAQRASAGNRPILGVASHLARYPPVQQPTPYFQFLDTTGTTPLSSLLTANRYVVYLGYYGIDREALRAIRTTPGVNATWIFAPEPHQPDLTYWGDVVINGHWELGDATIPVPGYDVSLMPASGISQLFMYDLMVKSAAAVAPSAVPPTVSIVTPAQNATVSGAGITVTATAAAASGLSISTIQIKLDGAAYGAPCSSSPCSLTLNANLLASGTHSLTASATDSANSSATSSAITINVAAVTTGGSPLITAQALGPVRNNQTVLVGMQFTPSSALTVTSLGRFCLSGNVQTHALKLALAGTGADVPGGSATVSLSGCAAGQYQYGALNAPVTLQANTAYILVSQEAAGGDTWYDLSPVTPISGVTVNAPVYFAGGYVAVPVPGYSYVPVNLLYSTSFSVTITAPAPSTTVSGVTTFSASAPGATSVQFKINGNNAGSAVAGAGPTYNLTYDATSLSNGAYQLTATATSASAGAVTSTPVTIIVNHTYAAPAGVGLVTGYNLGSLRNNISGFIGMQFTVGCAPIGVAGLGRLYVAGNTGSHTVKLVRASDGGDVPGASVNISLPLGVAGQFTYAAFATPVTLAAGASYYAVSLESAGGDSFYDYGPVATLNVVAVNGPVQANGSSWSPVAAPGSSFVPVDLLLLNPNAISAPVTAITSAPPVTHIASGVLAGINHILISGQSLAIGYAGSPALTTTQPYSNVMLNPAYTALIPLVEGNQSQTGNVETIGSALGNTMTALSPSQTYLDGVTNNGRNSLSYAQLSKGTAPYNDGLSQMTAMKTLAQAKSSPYRVAAIAAVHGETDQGTGTTAAAFEADMIQWQHDYQTDAQAISGQTAAVPLFLDQVNSWGYSQLAAPTVALGQLAASEDQPGAIVMVGPKYQYHYADGIHLDNYGYRQEGEQFGKVLKEVLVDGMAWRPVSPKAITRSGATITAQFYVPAPPLRFDLSTVLPKAAMGFEYFDGSACSPYITSAQISAADTITLTLSGAPSGSNERLRYAYTAVPGSFTGKDQPGSARGNLKDSDASASLYGNDLSNWAVSFDKPVSVGTPIPPPTVNITGPLSGASLAGTATFSATAVAGSGLTIASVQFQVNGSNAGAAAAGAGAVLSANVPFDTTTLTNGAYQLTAIAKDSAGNMATSAAVSFTVSNASVSAGTPFVTGFTPAAVRTNFNGFVGMQFQAGAKALVLSSLGRMCLAGNTGSHVLKLVAANGADLAGGSATVSMAGCTAGQFQYAKLAAPVQLSANATYYLMSQEINGDGGYDYSHVNTTAAATVLQPVYYAGGQYVGVPVFYGDPAYCYIPLNFLY